MTLADGAGRAFSCMSPAGLGHPQTISASCCRRCTAGCLQRRYLRIMRVYQSPTLTSPTTISAPAKCRRAFRGRSLLGVKALSSGRQCMAGRQLPASSPANSVRRTAPDLQGVELRMTARHMRSGCPHRAPEVARNHGDCDELTAWQSRQATRSSSSRALRLGQQPFEVAA